MRKIVIAVGSKRGPKLNAVTEAIEEFGAKLAAEAHFEVIGVEVESGVNHTPASRGELMRGARQRAEAMVRVAQGKNEAWDYFVGLEGGLDVAREEGLKISEYEGSDVVEDSHRRVFLESWAYVTDSNRGYYGRSGGIELPEALAHEVLEKGVELSVAIDKFAGAVGIRDAQGAWGVLSGNLISRQEAFRVAVIAACAPCYNAGECRRFHALEGL